MNKTIKRLFFGTLLSGLMTGGVQAANVIFSDINNGDALPGAGFGAQAVDLINLNILNVDVSLFSITAAAGNVEQMVDAVTFRISAPTGYFIEQVEFREEYVVSITQNAGGGLAVAGGTLSVYDTVSGEVGLGGLGTHTYTANTPNGGAHTNVDLLDLLSPGTRVTDAIVTINNNLLALSMGTGATAGVATIAKDFTAVEVTLQAVPIPAAAWLFGSVLVGFVTYSRRRTS